jgi:hypothetical protein
MVCPINNNILGKAAINAANRLAGGTNNAKVLNKDLEFLMDIPQPLVIKKPTSNSLGFPIPRTPQYYPFSAQGARSHVLNA